MQSTSILQAKGILWAVPQRPVCCIPKFVNAPMTQHITLLYNVSLNDVQGWVGKTFTVSAIAECWDYWNQAIEVRLPDDIPCQNPYPHITVSWEFGSLPRCSNEMLAKVAHNRQPLDYQFDCRIEFQEFDR